MNAPNDETGTGPKIELRGLKKILRRQDGARRHRPHCRHGRIRRRDRRLGHGQVGHAEMHPGPAVARRWVDPHRRRRRDRADRPGAPGTHRKDRHAVPERSPVRFPEGLGKCRLRTAQPVGHAEAAGPRRGPGEAGAGRAGRRCRRAVAVGTVGRHAETGGAGPGGRDRSGNRLLRRADRRPRSDPGRHHQPADRRLRPSSRGERRLDHPRHGERTQDRRPDRHAPRRQDRLGRAGRRDRFERQRLRRPVHSRPRRRADRHGAVRR